MGPNGQNHLSGDELLQVKSVTGRAKSATVYALHTPSIEVPALHVALGLSLVLVALKITILWMSARSAAAADWLIVWRMRQSASMSLPEAAAVRAPSRVVLVIVK